MANEHSIDNVFEARVREIKGYPSAMDQTTADKVTWYREDSYKGKDAFLERAFSTASKSLKNTSGRPDYLIDTPNFYIVVEAKWADTTNANAKGKHRHSRYTDVKQYIQPGADDNRIIDTNDLYALAIDGALYYARFINSQKDVVAVGVSGTSKEDLRITSFYLPKGASLSSIQLIEDGGYSNAFKSIVDYKRAIWKLQGFEEKLYQDVYEDLRKYADACAKFLNTNGIDESDRLGLVSAVVLALTNEKSVLYEHVQKGIQRISPAEVEDALISQRVPLGVVVADNLPIEKQDVLVAYFKGLLNKPILSRNIDKKNKNGKIVETNTDTYFEIGRGMVDTLMSRLVYSLNEFIIKVYDQYQTSNIDVMGTFYSLFLQYAKADAKKGVVLTPRHITDLFCDLAEHFYEKPLASLGWNGEPECVQVLDTCTGSGGFLIAALNRMDKEIEAMKISDEAKNAAKEKVRRESLIGVELKDSMFVLAYANMRFHKDGKSSLYHGSSLYSGNDILANGKTMFDMIKEGVHRPNIGLINPPYEEDVFEFMDSMLRYLQPGGIGIAIVPINTQSIGISSTAKKNDLLSRNTLLASILMPTDLFNGVRGSGAATSTCILVFRAHAPHQTFVENGGLTYLADWSTDGFKLLNKQGRFEQDDKWYDVNNGYKKLYLDDLKTRRGETNSILSSAYKKDIHKSGAIKSIWKPIHKFNGIQSTIKTDKKGNVVYKKARVQKTDENGNLVYKKNGQPDYVPKLLVDARDEDGNLIPEIVDMEIYINEDWNVLDYVETDYAELTDNDFIKTLLNYNLFLYLKENNLLFEQEG